VVVQHIERPPAGNAHGALVFFHGYSGDPEAFVDFLNDIDPERRLHGYLPRAPHAGASWFDRDSTVPAERQLDALVEWLDGLPYARDRTVFGGWSQGANVAFSLALGPRYARPAGVIALGGGFRDELPPDLERPLPAIAIAHGRLDESVPVDVARRARDLLERAGASVLYRETDVGHELDAAVIPDLRAFLEKLPRSAEPQASRPAG
jgi:phospholipase/carboxylesterase